MGAKWLGSSVELGQRVSQCAGYVLHVTAYELRRALRVARLCCVRAVPRPASRPSLGVGVYPDGLALACAYETCLIWQLGASREV